MRHSPASLTFGPLASQERGALQPGASLVRTDLRTRPRGKMDPELAHGGLGRFRAD